MTGWFDPLTQASRYGDCYVKSHGKSNVSNATFGFFLFGSKRGIFRPIKSAYCKVSFFLHCLSECADTEQILEGSPEKSSEAIRP